MEKWVREDNNPRNGHREQKQRKTKTDMGERHHMVLVWWQQKTGWRGQASISQRHLGSHVLTRIMLREDNIRILQL